MPHAMHPISLVERPPPRLVLPSAVLKSSVTRIPGSSVSRKGSIRRRKRKKRRCIVRTTVVRVLVLGACSRPSCVRTLAAGARWSCCRASHATHWQPPDIACRNLRARRAAISATNGISSLFSFYHSAQVVETKAGVGVPCHGVCYLPHTVLHNLPSTKRRSCARVCRRS